MWERLKRRYTRLFFIIGGLLFIVDQIGRIQTVKDLYTAGKNWFASRSDVQLTWPPHTLLAVGIGVVLSFGTSFILCTSLGLHGLGFFVGFIIFVLPSMFSISILQRKISPPRLVACEDENSPFS